VGQPRSVVTDPRVTDLPKGLRPLFVCRFSSKGFVPFSSLFVRKGEDLRDLQQQVTEAVAAYFDEGKAPVRIRLHFVNDPILVRA
jgi:hypothetical protein